MLDWHRRSHERDSKEKKSEKYREKEKRGGKEKETKREKEKQKEEYSLAHANNTFFDRNPLSSESTQSTCLDFAFKFFKPRNSPSRSWIFDT